MDELVELFQQLSFLINQKTISSTIIHFQLQIVKDSVVSEFDIYGKFSCNYD